MGLYLNDNNSGSELPSSIANQIEAGKPLRRADCYGVVNQSGNKAILNSVYEITNTAGR